MKQTETTAKYNILGQIPNPHQIRGKSTEFKDEPTNTGETPVSHLYTTLGIIPPTAGQSHIISMLQYIYGIRVSEALNITNEDIDNNGFIFIKGKKGSENRIIYLKEILPYKTNKPHLRKAKVFTISYKQYYRVCRKYNIVIPITKGRKRDIVTHAYRHNRIKDIFELAKNNLKDTKRFTGQKHNKSTLHYINSN